MSVINMMQTVKQVHSKDIVMVKIGEFYQCFGKDAVILSYLFGYKIQTRDNIPFCGFPFQAENRVKATLEQKKINYILLDRRNNYEVGEEQNYKNLNTYTNIYEKAKRYVSEKNRIEGIYQKLMEEVGKKGNIEKIRKIEEIVTNERREV